MSQVFVNPEEIDVFINEIRIFLDTLNSATNRLNNAFENLSSTWQDRKRAEFEEEYRELLRVLKIFEESSEEKINHLAVLSQKAKDYLGS
jgi:uncharacterized protein YukE